ncbi:hypothetical protein DWX59_11895 [Enterocloster aldenensis]|uniref:tripartite tricarboxylate transporter TctB family protein n=1 Tax=Enterocloster aldenensis TaxID=358742 RepID=UPI000E42269B|nr:hypothetical protein DWX59_11895 [Enterocloster aldenensis]
MKLKVKLMPAFMTVLSALYFIYVLSGGDTTLSADAVGGDPGGKVLPLAMAVFLFAGFLYITLKERPDGQGMDTGTKRLFLITLILSVLYVLLIRHAGFILLSSLLLYCLEYIYTAAGQDCDKKQAVLGGLGTMGITALGYFIMRTITKSLMHLGRIGDFPGIFTVSTFQAVISLAYVALFTFAVSRTLCRKLKAAGMKRIADPGLLTLATVLFLYVVFKQFFSVNLAPGILDF